MNCLKSFLLAFCLLLAVVSAKGQEKVRTERDLLGEKEVPADAYYGVQTARALENSKSLEWAW
jgi:aspartate ammonia-lyase